MPNIAIALKEEITRLARKEARTFYSWEQGKSRPRQAQLAAFAAIRSPGKTDAKARLKQLGAKVNNGRKKKG